MSCWKENKRPSHGDPRNGGQGIGSNIKRKEKSRSIAPCVQPPRISVLVREYSFDKT